MYTLVERVVLSFIRDAADEPTEKLQESVKVRMAAAILGRALMAAKNKITKVDPAIAKEIMDLAEACSVYEKTEGVRGKIPDKAVREIASKAFRKYVEDPTVSVAIATRGIIQGFLSQVRKMGIPYPDKIRKKINALDDRLSEMLDPKELDIAISIASAIAPSYGDRGGESFEKLDESAKDLRIGMALNALQTHFKSQINRIMPLLKKDIKLQIFADPIRWNKKDGLYEILTTAANWKDLRKEQQWTIVQSLFKYLGVKIGPGGKKVMPIKTGPTKPAEPVKPKPAPGKK